MEHFASTANVKYSREVNVEDLLIASDDGCSICLFFVKCVSIMVPEAFVDATSKIWAYGYNERLDSFGVWTSDILTEIDIFVTEGQ